MGFMEKELVIFLVVNGVVTGFLVMIGFYLLLSVRSAFRSDVEPNEKVRKTAGWNAMLWALTFGATFLNLIYKGTVHQYHAFAINVQCNLLVLPGFGLFLLHVLELNRTAKRMLVAQMIIPAALIIGYFITHEMWMFNGTFVYWGLCAIAFILWCVRQEKIYDRRLKDLYSDMEHHDAKWAFRLMLFFLLYFVIFVIAHILNQFTYYYILYAACLALWFYIVYLVDSHERQENFWLGAAEIPALEEEDENPSDTDGLTDDSASEKKGMSERDLSWVGERLAIKCEETQLYLRHELTIDRLAKEIGSNRTYISKYLVSKGMSYYIYINALRVEHAKQLMESNEKLTLSDITYACGYKNDTTFRRAFMEVEKCTPSEYLKNRRLTS